MVLNQNFDRIDKGLVLNAGYSTGDNNTYVLTIPDIEKLTSEDIGASFKFFAHKDSTGYVSIKINDDEAKPLYDGKKKQVKKILTGVPYTIVWDGNLNFFLSSGGVDESDETTVGTDGSKVLEGETFIGSDGEIHTGTIPKRGDSTINLGINQTVELPAGYYTKVKATQNVNYHSGGWSPSEYGVYSDYFYEHLDRAYYDGAETRVPISTVSRVLGFNENNVVGNVGGINGNGLVYMSGTITINNTDLNSAEYSLQLSQLNLPRTPKFVSCNWRITWYRKEYGTEKTYTNSDYAFFDFVNSKCYYPTNTMWSHEGGSGTYKIVDTIRNFKDHNLLRMHTESNDRSRIPTGSSIRRDPMIVDWFAVA